MHIKVFSILILALLLTACSAQSKAPKQENKVDKILESQIEAADSGNTDESVTQSQADNAGGKAGGLTPNAPLPKAEVDSENSSKDPDVDYDLTTMNSDLVYASVYQMMLSPEDFVGKSVKMRGKYFASFYELTGKMYHYVIIEDAAACCAQGLEFVWEDGSHVYPDEYPENESYVEVKGIFRLYQDEGDERMYCRIEDSTMELIE